jgi:hypothetical protein
MKPVFVLGCYGCVFHGTGNSAQLWQNVGISGQGGAEPSQTPLPPRHATDIGRVFWKYWIKTVIRNWNLKIAVLECLLSGIHVRVVSSDVMRIRITSLDTTRPSTIFYRRLFKSFGVKGLIAVKNTAIIVVHWDYVWSFRKNASYLKVSAGRLQQAINMGYQKVSVHLLITVQKHAKMFSTVCHLPWHRS